MNERIEKLFEQALEEFKAENKYATIIVPNPLKEKFAELIVQECMTINKQELSFTAFERLMNKYQENFGVEDE